MQDLNLLTTFVQVVQTRSFTTAAKLLGVSPSGISKSIRRLEEELRTKLLNRTTRSISLTEDGKTVYEMGVRVLADIQDAEAQVMNAQDSARGRLRIQIPVGFAREVVIPALPAFVRRHPELTIDLQLGDPETDLAARGIDIILKIGPLRDSRLIQRKLCDLRLMFCASREYLDHYGMPQTPDDLERHICIGYIPGHSLEYRTVTVEHKGRQRLMRLSGQINVNNAQCALDLAIAGEGIALISAFAAHKAVRSGQVEVILKNCKVSGGSIYALTLPSRHSSARVRAFTKFLDELMDAGRPWEKIM